MSIDVESCEPTNDTSDSFQKDHTDCCMENRLHGGEGRSLKTQQLFKQGWTRAGVVEVLEVVRFCILVGLGKKPIFRKSNIQDEP